MHEFWFIDFVFNFILSGHVPTIAANIYDCEYNGSFVHLQLVYHLKTSQYP